MFNYWGTLFVCGDFVSVVTEEGDVKRYISGEIVKVTAKLNSKNKKIETIFIIKGYWKNLNGDGQVYKRLSFNLDDIHSIFKDVKID